MALGCTEVKAIKRGRQTATARAHPGCGLLSPPPLHGLHTHRAGMREASRPVGRVGGRLVAGGRSTAVTLAAAVVILWREEKVLLHVQAHTQTPTQTHNEKETEKRLIDY